MSQPERKLPRTRIDRCFEDLKKADRKALVTFVTAGDPDYHTSLSLIKRLPAAGANILELGMPFSDPMADGPAIQASSTRALKDGQTLRKTLDMVCAFREENYMTPVVLMGYYNPIYVYPAKDFLKDAAAAGVDGLIIVDLPPEADDELCLPALDEGISFIRLATPTTDDKRLPTVLRNSSGFVYYVSIAGITGTKAPNAEAVRLQVDRIKAKTSLPVAVGFGVKTQEQARSISAGADGIVVGSALVTMIAESLDSQGKATDQTLIKVTDLVKSLSEGLHDGQPPQDMTLRAERPLF